MKPNSPSNPKHSTIWEAQPHTIAKIQILRSYLSAYFQILGRNPTSPGANILYVDGFSGPGEYTNDPEGSPVAAINAALEALRKTGDAWNAGSIRMAFIEKKKDRVAHLTNVLARFDNKPELQSGRIEYRIFKGEFDLQITEVEKWCPEPFVTNHPLFCFIDPFGAKGAPFQLIRRLLSTPCSEILLNLDTDGISRIVAAKDSEANIRNLDDIFDCPSTIDPWNLHLDWTIKQSVLIGRILALYRKRLQEQANAEYVFPFEMCSEFGVHNYYLVFASKHRLGLKKMKEAMKSLDQTGAYSFADSTYDSGQGKLMRFDVPADHADVLFELCKGQKKTYEELDKWALLHSPFINPKEMLKALQIHGRILVHAKLDEKIRKGDFPKEKIELIEFAPERNQPFRQTK